MKTTILAENLQKKLSIANHAISSRNQLPILSHFLLEATTGKLKIYATDLEIGIETTVQAETTTEGSIAIPAKLFSELVNSLPQEKITLEVKDNAVEVSTKKTKTIIQTSPKEEFPLLYEEKGNTLISFKKGSFKTLFNKVVFSASVEATRPALSGVLIKKTEKGIIAVATDGYRLSLNEINGGDVLEIDSLQKSVIIPARVIKEAGMLSEEGDITVYLSEKNNQLLFQQEETVLVGRLIEAEFPNYEKVLPTDVATKAFFDREQMLKAVKLCSLFAKEAANIIKLSFLKDKVVVSSKTPSLGENIVDVESRLEGEENEIAFNARYISEALANIPENELSFEMTGPLNPGVFRVAGDTSFLHLIMPIRTQE